MATRDALLPEFDHEMAVMRKVLARVPLVQGQWKPHARSMSLGALASHLADIPGWLPAIMRADHYDMKEEDEGVVAKHATVEALLAEFDENVRKARALIDGASEAEWQQPWALRQNGETILTMPRAVVVRTFLLNHAIHHRGQLSVYLRLREVPVPAIYGPSADEQP